MANAPVDPNEAHAAAVADVKRLMRLARTGALATLEATGGAPLTTLVGVASDFDGAPLFLMSTLSRHTRNLAHDPRASLLLTGRHERGDPLNHPRVTLSGQVERCAAPRAKVRYLQRNPKAGLYAGFADFALYQLRIDDVHFNGGFGRAAPLTVAEVLAPARGRSGAGRGRRAAPRGGERAGPSPARAARGAQGFRRLRSGAGGRSGSTPRASTSPPAAAPPAPNSRRRRMTRRHGGRVSNSCSRPASAGAPIRSAPSGQINANKRK